MGASAVTLTLSQAGATAYTVRNIYGETITSGSVTGSTFTISSPEGGWACGWYRVYITGPNTDSSFGNSYGVYNFVVLRDTTGFSHNLTPTEVAAQTRSVDEAEDPVAKAVLGIGTSRAQIRDATWYTVSADVDNHAQQFQGGSVYSSELNAAVVANYAPDQTVRPWPVMCQFPNGTVDSFTTGANNFIVYCKDGTLDGSTIFIKTSAGTSSGMKVQVYSPDSSTLVETYDNLATGTAAKTAINGVSSYIHLESDSGGITVVSTGPTAIGSARRAGVINVVAFLYPLGIHHYEGPLNEPAKSTYTAHQMKVYQGSVHAGNASAKAIGPCFVDINDLNGWKTFFDAGGGDYCDEISTHMYNSQYAGEVQIGKNNFSAWFDLLAKYGYSDKPVWSTESTHFFIAVNQVYHPRLSRNPLLMTLYMEQWGIPRERNQVWYDISHGFWSYPAFWEMGDGSLQPYPVLYRVLAEETYGKLHHHPLDFGSVQGNVLFIGSVYYGAGDDTSTVVLIPQSYLDGSPTVTLKLLGTVPASVTVVDGLGNESTVTVSSSLAEIPVNELPTYVRLPVACRARVDSVLDWGTSPPPPVGQYARGSTVASDGATLKSAPLLGSNTYRTQYNSGYVSPGLDANVESIPEGAQLIWNSSIDIDRVIVVGLSPWQLYSALIDFDIQTSTDSGATWTTRATVNKGTPPQFQHGSDATNANTFYETYYDGQFHFNVPLGATYTVNGVRLWCRDTTYGGEVAAITAAHGQGNTKRSMCLAELIVPSSSSPTPYTEGYASLVSAETGLIGYWRLGDANTSQGDAVVSEVNSPTVNGTYEGDSSHGSSGPVSILPGAINDGNSAINTINLGSVLLPGSTVASLQLADTWSIEFWNNDGGDTSTSSGQTLVGHTKPGATDKTSILWAPTVITLKVGSTTVATSSSKPSDGNWHHYVVTKDGADVHIYIDGVDVTVLGTNVTMTAKAYDWFVGFREMDEIAFYSVALSSSQVSDHFNSATTPAGVPLLEPNFFDPSVKIAGTATVGNQLGVSWQGTWRNAPTSFTYQWQSSADGSTGWADITGETNADILLASGQSTKYLRCQVTASNIVGASAAAASSNVLGPVS